MEKISSKLFLGVSYRQVVLTLPEQLWTPFYQFKRRSILYSEFIKLAHECLQEVIRTMLRNNQLKIAVIVFMHTNGRDSVYKPHLHVILGEGAFNPITNEWLRFTRIPLSLLRKAWQYHLLSMINRVLPGLERLVDYLWREYPDGFYAHPGDKDKVPTKSYRGLIKYLTKYLSSPPIALSRIVEFDGINVTYRYKSHRTKRMEHETIDAVTFIGRMVQHIFPKGFQRVRYFGLQATASFKKYFELIAKAAGDLVDVMIATVKRISYAQMFEEVARVNPLKCTSCGSQLELWQLYHPSKGVFYDIFDPPC